MKRIFTIIPFIYFFIFFLILDYTNFNENQLYSYYNLKNVKIIIVNSGNYKNPNFILQQYSFLNELSKFDKKLFNFFVKVYYLGDKFKYFEDTYELQLIIKQYNKKIINEQPDIVYLIGDDSFKYFAAKLSQYFPIIASNININIKIHLKNVYIIKQYIKLNKLIKFLEQNNIFIHTFYILIDYNYTLSSSKYFLLRNLINEFYNNKIQNYYIIRIKNTSDLINNIERLNDQDLSIIFVLLHDNNIEKMKKIFFQYNVNHLIIGLNPLMCSGQYAFHFCISSSNEGIGKQASEILLTFLKNKYYNENKKLNYEYKNKTKFIINYRQLKKIKNLKITCFKNVDEIYE